MRRLLVLLLAFGLLGTGAAAVDAKPRKKSPRLHAFRSCTNLLGYAQRNGLRVIRATPVRVAPVAPPPESVGGGQEDSGSGGGGAGGGPQPQPIAAPAPAAGRDETSSTNVQEAGVDEPDWVKAAGTTIYAAQEGRLHAIDASADRPRELGSIALPGYTQELLVRRDRALVIATIGFGPIAYAAQVPGVAPTEWLGRTRLLEVDISDPASMKVLRTLDVEGSYLSARLTGATARVIVRTEPRGLVMPDVAPTSSSGEVRRDWRAKVRRTRTRAWLPSAVLRDRRKGTQRRRALVRCRQVRRTQSFSGLGTLTVLTIDMERGLPEVDADALMTDGDTVYASEDRLYVASQRWLAPDADRAEILDEAATGLHAFSTEKAGETAYAGSGEVPGYLLNQWSLSEHEGTLRAATTSMPPWNSSARSQSAVRTLQERDGKLVQVGEVGGLGQGERIYAVRYIGDTGFVVTFRLVDPLYTLDLSDPAKPRKVGELKVPGYSAYLHPVGDGLLLGVGQDATLEGRRTGVQVSLFDVSDLAKPVQLDRYAVGGYSSSSVESDHHAFLWWAPERLALVPAVRYDFSDGSTDFAGSIALRVDRAGGIVEAGRMAHPAFADGISFDRAVVVGPRLLLLSSAGVLSTFTGAPGPGQFVRYADG
ncbi:MAG TPA: beta-propeller domain-containing protein [Solirubrobacteraceae bacterium]|nr:beta-propeller domain-containing protein [Solirubrobacteraceae bacterium]